MQVDPPRSFSSHCMSYLANFRNPRLNEHLSDQSTRVGIAEISLIVLTAIAIVESIALVLFSLFSLLFYKLDDRPFKYAVMYLESSLFTVIWGSVNLIFNVEKKRLCSNECMARLQISEIFLSEEHSHYIYRNQHQIAAKAWMDKNFGNINGFSS